MTSPQRLVVEDYLWRESLAYVAAALVYMVALLCGWWYPPLSLMGFSAGCFVLLCIKGSTHQILFPATLLALPITATQLGLCWRLLFFILPAAAAFVILCLGTGIGAVLDAPHVTADRFIMIAIAQTLFFGWFFFLLMIPPRQPAPGEPKRLAAVRLTLRAAGIVAIPFPLVCAFQLPVTARDITGFHILAAGVLAVGTFSGWRRAGAAFRGHPFQPTAAKSTTAVFAKPSKEPWQAAGGILHYIIHITRGAVLAAILLLGYHWLAMPPSGHLDEKADSLMTLIIILMGSSILTPLGQLRLLRSLPISSRALTSLFILLPLATAAAIGLAFGIFHSWRYGVPFPFDAWRNIICVMAATSLATPLLLRFGSNSLTVLIAMTPAVAGIIGIPLFGPEYPQLARIYFPATACLILVAGWSATYRLLRSAHPWRAQAFRSVSNTRRSA